MENAKYSDIFIKNNSLIFCEFQNDRPLGRKFAKYGELYIVNNSS